MGQLIRNNLEIGRVDIKDPHPNYWQYATLEDVTVGSPVALSNNDINPTIANIKSGDDVMVGIVVLGNDKSSMVEKNNMVGVLCKGCISVPFLTETVDATLGVFYDFVSHVFTDKKSDKTIELKNAFFYTTPEKVLDGRYSIMLNIFNDLRVVDISTTSNGGGENEGGEASRISMDIDHYYTKQEIDEKISSDTDHYYTKQEIDEKLNNLLKSNNKKP